MEISVSPPQIEIDTQMDSGPTPNIIINRFDLRFPLEPILWVHSKAPSCPCTVGLRVADAHAWIGILYMPVTSDVLRAIFQEVFAAFPRVRRISFQCTQFDPSVVWPYTLTHSSSSWYLELPDTYEALLARATGKFRHRIKYEHRRLEKAAGPLSCVRYSVSQVPKNIYPLFLAFKTRKYSDRTLTEGIHGILNGRNIPASHCYVLRSKETILAILFTAEDQTDPYLINLTYNPEFSKYSPGKLLYIELLRSLILHGQKILYLGSGAYLYKRFFGSATTGYWVGDAFRSFADLEGDKI